MLPGWTLDHQVMLTCMEPVFSKRDGWKRLYLDLPGTGRSKARPSIKNTDDMLAAVVNLLDSLLPNEPFVVCAYSYGAMIARGLARARPSRVRGMFLFAPVTVAEPSRRALPEHRVLHKDRAFVSRLSPEELADFESTAVLLGEHEWARYHDEILVPAQAANSEFLEQVRHDGYGFSYDLDRESAEFEHPALVITGRQDNVVGFRDAWMLTDKFPRATFVALDGAGHVLQIDQPDLFESLVGEWLARIEAGPFDPSTQTS